MAHLDRASLEALRQALLPLAHAGEPTPEQYNFCHFYGLDFTDRIEGVCWRLGRVESGQYALAVHRWDVPGATRNLLLVHGYTDHVGLFGHLVEFGLANRCNVIAFDLPGHGLSTGEFVAIDDFADYSRAIVDVMAAAHVTQLPIWVMAQSTGCTALIDYAGKYPWEFSATVFLAPLIRPAAWGRIRIGHVVLRRFRKSIGRKFTDNSGDKAFLTFLRNDPLQSRTLSVAWIGALRRWLAALKFQDLGVGPVLVIQGDADGTVAWKYNMKHIVRLFPGCQIEYVPGAGHHLANETGPVRQLYLEKVRSFVGL